MFQCLGILGSPQLAGSAYVCIIPVRYVPRTTRNCAQSYPYLYNISLKA